MNENNVARIPQGLPAPQGGQPDVQQLLIRLGQLKAQNERLTRMLYKSIYERDLRELNSAYPNLHISDLRELGSEYMRLRASGVSNAAAYNAVNPGLSLPQLGYVERSGGQRDFITPDETDRLSAEQLSDPEIFALVRDSMTRWK